MQIQRIPMLYQLNVILSKSWFKILVTILIGAGIGFWLWAQLWPPFPFYPGAELIWQGQTEEERDSTGYTIGHVARWELHTTDSPATVMIYYDQSLPKKGWQLYARPCQILPTSDVRIYVRQTRHPSQEWLVIGSAKMIEAQGFSIRITHVDPTQIDMTAYVRIWDERISAGFMCLDSNPI